MSRESRWWFLRKIGRLLTSGFHRVEFTDFWLGDQLCSLTFSLGGIYFVGCSYAVGFHSDQFKRCSTTAPWGVPFFLGTLPLLARFFQSIRRWWDSSLAGKYFMGILCCFLYFLWRHHGSKHDTSFVFFCFFETIGSLYAISWDLLVDWSVLRPHARFVLLRDELVYSSYILVRFFSPSFALLEVLRRWQWNIYRLESEHIGNMDQYRITREVPLPYSFDELGYETDAGDEDDRTRTALCGPDARPGPSRK
ncbi:EXS-domain-containing protein [Lactarius vividus]|nr:EXS-domain-containing protein [Lactarius vividus]